MKKISVIMPCYNAKDTLNISLSHLERQTIGIDSLEIILVDDASTDGGTTLNMLMDFEKKYPDNVIVLPLEYNVKQGAARNIALSYASGKYVAYCDADDWYALDAFEQLYDLAEENSADVVEYWFKRVNDLSEINSKIRIEDTPTITQITCDDIRKQFFMGDIFQPCWNKIYRTDFLQNNYIRFAEGILHEEIPFTFMSRLVEKIHVQTSTELYFYYANENSCTSINSYESLLPNIRTGYAQFLSHAKSDMSLYEACREEIDFIFWIGYFLLPLIYKANDNCTFYTREEFIAIAEFVRNNISHIGSNKYFIEKFSDAPIIGELAFMDLSNIDIEELREAFNGFVV